MHLEERETAVGRISAKIATDREGGADYQIGKIIFRGEDNEIVVVGDGYTLEELDEHVREADPDGAPGVISVDPCILVVVKPVGENAGDRKTKFFTDSIATIEIIEMAPLSAAL